MRSSLLMGALLLGSTIITGPAWSGAIVRASADSGYESASADSSDDPNLVSEPFVSARAHATELSASSLATAGAIDSCFQTGNPAPGCVTIGTEVQVRSYASANGNAGYLRAAANSGDGGQGSASATLIDSITLTNPVIDVFIDVNAIGGASVVSPGQSVGQSSIFFSLFLDTPSPNLDQPQRIFLFSMEAFKDDEDSGFIAYLLDDPDNVADSGSSIPGSFDLEIDLSDPAFAGIFGLPGPAGFDLDGPLPLGFMLMTSAACFDDSNCFAQARVDNTLYIALDGASANGYSYPGRSVVGPPPTGIPAPASGLLLLSGLAALAGLRRRA